MITIHDGKEVEFSEGEVKKEGMEWASGCSKCKHGIISAPPLTNACTIHMERLIQHIDGAVVYCNCRAGDCADRLMQRRWANYLIDARTDADQAEYAKNDTHLEIEIFRAKIVQDRLAAARKNTPMSADVEEEDEFPAPPPMHYETIEVTA
jgi:hypothetical protein